MKIILLFCIWYLFSAEKHQKTTFPQTQKTTCSIFKQVLCVGFECVYIHLCLMPWTQRVNKNHQEFLEKPTKESYSKFNSEFSLDTSWQKWTEHKTHKASPLKSKILLFYDTKSILLKYLPKAIPATMSLVIVFLGSAYFLFTFEKRKISPLQEFFHNCKVFFSTSLMWLSIKNCKKPRLGFEFVRNSIYVNIEWQILWWWCTQKIIYEYLSWLGYWIRDEKSMMEEEAKERQKMQFPEKHKL